MDMRAFLQALFESGHVSVAPSLRPEEQEDHIWDTEEQQETLRALVQDVTASTEESPAPGLRHGQADSHGLPNPEALARDVAWIEEQARAGIDATRQAWLRDRLAVLDGRTQWVQNSEQREYLAAKIREAWALVETPVAPA